MEWRFWRCWGRKGVSTEAKKALYEAELANMRADIRIERAKKAVSALDSQIAANHFDQLLSDTYGN